MLYLKLIGYSLLFCLGLYGYNLLQERDETIKTQAPEIHTLKSQTSSKQVVTERIIREPGGRVIEEREKVVERTKVLTQTADKSSSSATVKEVKHARYSLGIQYRVTSDDWRGDLPESLKQPVVEVGAALGRGLPVWAVGAYDFYDRSLSLGLRVEF